jgi:hypothetical protein
LNQLEEHKKPLHAVVLEEGYSQHRFPDVNPHEREAVLVEAVDMEQEFGPQNLEVEHSSHLEDCMDQGHQVHQGHLLDLMEPEDYQSRKLEAVEQYHRVQEGTAVDHSTRTIDHTVVVDRRPVVVVVAAVVADRTEDRSTAVAGRMAEYTTGTGRTAEGTPLQPGNSNGDPLFGS